jgi:intracellular septation protein A
MCKMPKIISGHNTKILNSAAWINMQQYILILCGAITQKQSDHQLQTAMKTVAVHIWFYIGKNNWTKIIMWLWNLFYKLLRLYNTYLAQKVMPHIFLAIKKARNVRF